MATRETGKVKWFNEAKGYGFIVPDAGDSDLFVHANDLPEGLRQLMDDTAVTFDVAETRKGRRATNIALA